MQLDSMNRRSVCIAAVLVLLAGCGGGPSEQQPGAPASGQTAQSTLPPPAVPLSALPKIEPQGILDHIKVLASDKFEGRKPGTAGEELTVDYLQSQLKAMGLEPGNPDGTYIQEVPLVGITGAQAKPLTIANGSKSLALAWKDEVVAWTKHVAPTASIANSDVVFAGYGVEAPEYEWDDFKGVDVAGKTIIVLVGDPPVPDPSDPSKLDPKVFGGNAMTYYGRWTYKFEEGARRHAAAVLIVHETGPAGYGFQVVQGNLGERFDTLTPDKNMGRAAIEGWLSLDAARKLFALGGQDYDALKKQALRRDFKPVSLRVKASMAIHNTIRTINSRNVVARLQGSDPQLKDQHVVYTAHWDHFGIGDPVNGDRIYNGARDNASGSAGVLEIARAFTKVRPQPKRSILFLFVTSEEQGLLGSQYYSQMPLYPLAKTAANINIDELNVFGPTSDITVIGLGASDLDDYLRQAADEQNHRTLRADPNPEKGFYYRSDHFNFALQGVPALDPEAGVDSVDSSNDVRKKEDDWEAHDYHQPSDEVRPDWNLNGAAEDMELLFAVGYRVANADKLPEWKPGNEFKAKRDAMMKK